MKPQLGACPRCSGILAIGYGAISRTDDETEICGPCGSDEVYVVLEGRPAVRQDEWPVEWCESTRKMQAAWAAFQASGDLVAFGIPSARA
jgi:hypothetical protein